MNVLIAPSGFKESLEADEVATCIARGLLRADPTLHIETLPIVDGGEGTARILAELTGGSLREVRVTGPVEEPVDAHFAMLGGNWAGTAVVEMAAAAGLRLVPASCRDPLKTTTRGVGELIRAALDAGATQILVGCGDSGTNDAGAGAAQALGVRLLDRENREIGSGGAELRRLAHVDVSQSDPRLNSVKLEVACNWSNVLCGPNGVARTFGPQKGAQQEQIQLMEEALERFAAVVKQETDLDVRSLDGGGASGGLGAGMHALLRATLLPRYEVVFRYLDVDALLSQANIVFTAEGRIDAQTARGKVPAEIARRAKEFGVPVIVLAGEISQDARVCLDSGIDAYESILRAPCDLIDAMADSCTLLAAAAEQVWRMVRVGIAVSRQRSAG